MGVSRSGSLGINWLAIALVAAFTVAVLWLGFWAARDVNSQLTAAHVASGRYFAATALQPYVQSLERARALSPADREALHNNVRRILPLGDVLTVKIWLPDGQIVYHSHQAGEEKRFDNAEIEAALGGSSFGRYVELVGDAHRNERLFASRLYEIFVPLYSADTGKVIAVAELYKDDEAVREALRSGWMYGLLIIAAVVLPIMLLSWWSVQRSRQTVDATDETLRMLRSRNDDLVAANTGMRVAVSDALTRSAELDELRQRKLAAQIHDGVAQKLGYVLLRLQELEKFIPETADGKAKAGGLLTDLTSVAQDSVTSLRALMGRLFMPEYHPAMAVDDLIQLLAHNHERRTGKSVAVTSRLPLPVVGEEMKQCVARVIQEALENAHKHGSGTGTTVDVKAVDGQLVVTVSNTFASLPKDVESLVTDGNHLGIASMRFRAQAMAGNVELGIVDQDTAALVLRLPLERGPRNHNHLGHS